MVVQRLPDRLVTDRKVGGQGARRATGSELTKQVFPFERELVASLSGRGFGSLFAAGIAGDSALRRDGDNGGALAETHGNMRSPSV